MPAALRVFAEHNPFTVLTDAVRALYNGRDPGSDVLVAVLWAVGITAVFSYLASRKFASSTR
jgi:ABC-type multidrug transport system permease subunit